MTSQTETFRLKQYSDFCCWCVAAAMGLGATSLPRLLSLQADSLTQYVVVDGGFFLTGLVLGFLKTDRPWRWALASVLLLPMADLAGVVGNPSFSPLSSTRVVSYLVDHSTTYLARLLPTLVGAYVGSFWSGGRILGSSAS